MTRKWRKRKSILGDDCYEDEEGNKIRKRKSILGDDYYEDDKGNKIRKRKGILGDDYYEDERKHGFGTNEEKEKSGGFCFITTACVEVKGLTDDCPQLNTLRAFRDDYVKNLPQGDQVIREYYKIAPKIVSAIDRTEDRKEIYDELYERLVSTSLNLIKSEAHEKAFNN